MKALRLAWSLILVPKLFASLLLLPLLLSLVLVYVQLVVTGAVLQTTDTSPEAVTRNIKVVNGNNISRRILYNTTEALPTLKVCRWEPVVRNGKITDDEGPTSDDCRPDRLDAAIVVKDPAHFDSAEFEKIFDGNVERLHICKSCHPDVVIYAEETPVRSDIKSVWGGLILHMVMKNEDVQEKYIQVINQFSSIKKKFGEMYFSPNGLTRPAKISGITDTIAVVLNIASLIVISLWLALKAHRKVLDYFARSGALLPMVAATGKNSFYGAIWILTLLRVASFLAASVPMTVYTLRDFIGDTEIVIFNNSVLQCGVWVFAIFTSLALATLIASIADLKHRHNFLSFLYKYVPIIVCSFGALFWCATFLNDSTLAGLIRNFMAAIPVIGIAPVLVAPVFEPGMFILLSHAVLTVAVLFIALRHNARWFAAHLEEL